jgi:hypothetical protein
VHPNASSTGLKGHDGDAVWPGTFWPGTCLFTGSFRGRPSDAADRVSVRAVRKLFACPVLLMAVAQLMGHTSASAKTGFRTDLANVNDRGAGSA